MGGKKNQSREQFFVVNRENSIISLLHWGYLWRAVQILQCPGSVTLDGSHDIELLDLVLMLAMQPLLAHVLVTNCTDLKEAPVVSSLLQS